MGLPVGYIGPFRLQDSTFIKPEDMSHRMEHFADNTLYKHIKLLDLPMYIDQELQQERNPLVCGANERDYHFTGVSIEWLKDISVADLVAITQGDSCPHCQGELTIKKGVEIGHIFQLGDKYSIPLQGEFLDENGKNKPYLMGCYGIGVTRLLSAAIEQNHDDRGCIWHPSIAPYQITLIVANPKEKVALQFAHKLYEALQQRGIEVLLDDRFDRFGAKMSDFELIGIPYAVIIGKDITDNKVQLIERKTLAKTALELIDMTNCEALCDDLIAKMA